MDAEVLYERVEELPWGPGSVELQDELEISVSEDPETGHFEIWCEEFQLSGTGESYEEALADLSGSMESVIDDLAIVLESKLGKKNKQLLEKYKHYLPDEIFP
jgi:predicted RNase H-like HicB family nuclease